MGQDKQLRGHLTAMLVGAAFLVLGQLGRWPPETGLEQSLAGLTVAAVLIAVSLTAYEWRQAVGPATTTEARPVMVNAPGTVMEHRSDLSFVAAAS